MSESEDTTAGEEIFEGSTAVEKHQTTAQPVVQEDLKDAIKRINEGAKLTPELMTFEAVFKLLATQQAMIDHQQKQFKELMDAHNNLVEHFNTLSKNPAFILSVAGEVANFLEAKIDAAENEVEEKVSDAMIENVLYDATCPQDRDWTQISQLTFKFLNDEKTSIGLTVREWSDDLKMWADVEKPSEEKAPYYRACLKVMTKDNLPENVPYYFWYEKKFVDPVHDLVPPDEQSSGNTVVASKVSREENKEGIKFMYQLDDRGLILTYEAYATIDGEWEELEMDASTAAQYRQIIEEVGGTEGEVWYVEMTLEPNN